MASRVRGILVVLVAFFGTLLFTTPVYGDANVNYIVNVDTSLAIDLSTNDVTLNLFPNNHTFDYGDVNVSVTTNNPTGYKLSMSSMGTSLINQDDNTKTIPTLATLSGGYTDETFTTNRWGYHLGTTGNYVPFVSGVTLVNKTTLADNDVTTIRFAGKIDYNQSTGVYSLPITYSAVANYVPRNMQRMKKEDCPTTPSIVIDSRDGTEYYVQKLADGNCWMLDNLRLDPTTVSLDDLKGATNASDTSLTYLKNGGGSGQYPASGVTASSWQNSLVLPYVKTNYINTIPSSAVGAGSGKTGVFYNYCAASAGSYCYNSGVGNATEDICPYGWRMPTSSNYQAAYASYGSNLNNFRNALSLAIVGSVSGGSLAGQNGYARYYTSTYYNSGRMMYMFLSGSPNVSDNLERWYGASVRCVLK